MSDEKIEILEFTCPRCASNKFGSSLVNGSLIRQCHGQIEGRLCHFMWRDYEDGKYMRGTGHYLPVTLSAPGRVRQ